MVRKLFSYAVLVVVFLWLLFSYLPASVVTLPAFTTPSSSMRGLFQSLLVVFFVAFLLLQIWLLRSTQRMFRAPAADAESSPARMGLTPAAELFWTAVPIAMTIGLALLSYRTWSSLAGQG